ncbi:hypothetical protein [Nocardia wallacei]|uniref:hypothetical protein n=1 Tax=Nocardia wallacei TaxID=480035 RepID=UPI00245806AA|nr:hypothetical protein [Nocardia wallacei]
MDGVHRTEVDGVEAQWRFDQDGVGIMHVRNNIDGTLTAVGTDLSQARERLPELSRLWDAVRHDFWREYFPSSRSFPAAHTTRWLG